MLSPGTKLGSHEILALIGVGGMGEVYQAHDTKLGRDVAIKVLPEQFARDPDRLARFRREAHVLASLNHPNIAAIYGLEDSGEVHYLVLEFVPGDTLAQQLSREGPLQIEEALNICRQIADALEAAHEKPIVHRDLKPANVKVTPEGVVKVLDFGLAKAYADDPSETVSGTAPTLTMTPTMPGVIMGTAAYMSPEQARSKRVDKRADIWAFGCVLYELLTGKQAFPGESLAEIIASILKGEPDWQALPSATPIQVRDLLRRCLQKDKTLRLRDAGDARIEIQEALAAPAREGPALLPRIAGWRGAAVLALAAVVVAAIAGIVAWNLKSSGPTGSQAVARLSVALPPGEELSVANYPAIALSPDGTNLVYSARRGGIQQLYLRAMDSLEGKPIAGTEGGLSPFFSPDGQWVGFFAAGKLKKIAITGGSSLTLCDAAGAYGGNWAPNDTIYLARGTLSGLWQVSARGGTPQPFTKLDSQKGEVSHRWPQVLPGGKAVLFTVWTGPGEDERQIQLQVLASGERRVLVQGGHTGYYAPTGHLVYHQSGQGTLMALPFDLARLEPATSAPITVAEGVREAGEGAHYTFSGNGLLAYVPGSPRQGRNLVWVGRNGQIEPLAVPPRFYNWPRLSPDGQRVAFEVAGPQVDVWLYNLASGTSTRLTSEGSSQRLTWTPDGKRLTYRATRVGTRNLFWRATDGTGQEERLTTGQGNQEAGSWSPDGQVLAFTNSSTETGYDIWVFRLSDRKQESFLRTQFNEGQPKFSPDGRSLAYASDESGHNEIYVRAYPGPGGKLQISTEGGYVPVWNRNGRELFYLNGNKMMAVSITTQPSFSASKPSMLFDIPLSAQYDVSSDGRRFLMIKDSQESTSATQINVVLNWFEELKRRVPATQ